MDEMEDKLGALLNNPQLMQQIMTMAQSMGGPQQPEQPARQEPIGGIDLAMVQKLSGLAQKSGIDRREQALLRALEAYLTGDRVSRLEKAMRAAKMAKLATGLLGQQGLLGNGRG